SHGIGNLARNLFVLRHQPVRYLHPLPTRRSSDLGEAAGVPRRVIAASRFSEPGVAESLERDGIEAVPCDLLDPASLDRLPAASEDRKSTRLNSSHEWSSSAVFCLKKTTNWSTCRG